MPRKRRIDFGGHVYHVLNRSAGKRQLFATPSDYCAFEQVIRAARDRTSMRILAYCLMPNHWHFLLWPAVDGDLQRFVQWLSATHARRWNTAHQRIGHGAVYQSRFKSIPVTTEAQLLKVWRYVERNALRSDLVVCAEEWRWGSLWHRLRRSELLTDGPSQLPANWIQVVNEPQTDAELQDVRDHLKRGIPLGEGDWPMQRARGRPRS